MTMLHASRKGGRSTANNVQYRAPKRPIEKKFAQFHDDFLAAATPAILLVATDAETIVRIVGHIRVERTVAGVSDEYYTLSISVAPRGIPVVTPDVSGHLNEGVAKQLMWHYHVCLADENQTVDLEVDLKGMRKLAPGDELHLTRISNTNNGGIVSGALTMIMKE